MSVSRVELFAGLLALTLSLSASVSGMNGVQKPQRNLSIKAQAPASIMVRNLMAATASLGHIYQMAITSFNQPMLFAKNSPPTIW